MARIVLDYLWIFVLTTILLGFLGRYVPALGQSGTFVATMIAATGAGVFYRRRAGAVASKALAWRSALSIAVVTLSLVALVVAWLRRSGGLADLGAVSPLAYAIGLLVAGIVVLLVARLFFRWGTKLGGADV